jgi:hypothetical protein
MAVRVVSRDDLPGFLGEFRKMLPKAFSHCTIELLIGKHPVDIQSPPDAAGEKLFLKTDFLDVGLRTEFTAKPSQAGFQRTDRVVSDRLIRPTRP